MGIVIQIQRTTARTCSSHVAIDEVLSWQQYVGPYAISFDVDSVRKRTGGRHGPAASTVSGYVLIAIGW